MVVLPSKKAGKGPDKAPRKKLRQSHSNCMYAVEVLVLCFGEAEMDIDMDLDADTKGETHADHIFKRSLV